MSCTSSTKARENSFRATAVMQCRWPLNCNSLNYPVRRSFFSSYLLQIETELFTKIDNFYKLILKSQCGVCMYYKWLCSDYYKYLTKPPHTWRMHVITSAQPRHLLPGTSLPDVSRPIKIAHNSNSNSFSGVPTYALHSVITNDAQLYNSSYLLEWSLK